MPTPPHFVFGVDLDGCVGDYESAIRQAIAAELGIAPEEIGPQTSWNFAECWPVRDVAHYREIHARAVENHLFATMGLIEGASDALWSLSDAGVWIRIITHRLVANFGHARAVSDTVAWLDQEATAADGTRRRAIPYRDLCFIGDKPAVGCDAYLDDAPHNLAALREGGAYAICFDQLYNRHVEGPRAFDWGEVIELVLARRAALEAAA